MRTLMCWTILSLLVAGCTAPRRYTSLDLALLPCEQGDSPVFFRPVEFDKSGAIVYTSQVRELRDRFRPGWEPRPGQPPKFVTDLVFFVHGWNKNPSSAEVDYQNFLCRLHARLRDVIGEDKREGGLVVVGIFWPSTITDRPREPILLKPLSYGPIRERADMIAHEGLAPLLNSLTADIASQPSGLPVRLQLIGHSFGGRMLVGALETLSLRGELVPLMQAAGTVNVVLLNAAVPPERFEWLTEAVANAKRVGIPGRFTPETNSYLFNIHSFNDTANRVLFRIASAFNNDPSTCAAGACGVPRYATLCVDESGKVLPSRGRPRLQDERINVWNVDATSIVSEHTDIYKGRVASLIADLLYENDKSKWPAAPELSETAMRCGRSTGSS